MHSRDVLRDAATDGGAILGLADQPSSSRRPMLGGEGRGVLLALIGIMLWIAASSLGWQAPADFEPALGLLLVLVWRMPARPIWFAVLGAATAVALAMPGGDMLALGMAAAVVRVVAVLGGGVVLRHVLGDDDPLASLPGLARFVLIAGVATPALSATAVALVTPHGLAWWLPCFAVDAPSLVTVAPAGLILCRGSAPDGEWPRTPQGWAEAGMLVLLVSGAALAAGWAALAFLLAPSMMLAALRFGQTGAVVAIGAAVFTVEAGPGEGVPAVCLAALLVAALAVAAQRRDWRGTIDRLRESETRYRVLAEGTSDAVMLIDMDWTCRHASPSIETLLGFRVDQIVGHPIGACIHRDDLDSIRQAGLHALSMPDAEQTVVHRVRNRTGEWHWIETRLRALPETPEHAAGLACAMRDVSEQRARDELLERRATIDSLTGLLNRDSVRRAVDMAMIDARAEDQSLAFVLFDVDHFKRINDRHGHCVGDKVLQSIGASCHQVVRSSDVAGRVGGEEFAILLHGAHVAVAADVCRRLRQGIFDAAPCDDDGNPVRVTISAGIAILHPAMGQEDLVRAADKALYAAKDGGRDCVFANIDGKLVRAL